MNINRDYLIINDVKKSNVKLDNGSIFFYITDKNTQNIFVNLVINVSNNDLIQKYANIENAEDYTLTMNIVKPSNTYKVVEGKLHDKEKAIFEFDLKEDCCDEVGTYKCELLTKCNINDHEEITTSNKLTYKVKSSILNDLDDIVEAPEYPLVIQLFDKLSDIEQYEEDRRANEIARQLAEEQRQQRFNELDTAMVDGITSMDNKITDVEDRVQAKEQAVDKLIVDTKADIDDYKVAKDQEIDEYKAAKDAEINEAITNQNTAINTQNDRITVVENNVVAQNDKLDTLETKATTHEARITAVEAKNTEQDGRLDIAENRLANIGNDITNTMQPIIDDHASRLDAIEAIDVSQNSRLDAIEAKNQQQDDRLLDIEKVNSRQDIDIKCLYGASQTIDVTKEGNSIYLQNSNNGFAIINEIKGNTLVNCNKEPDKEIILNGNINTNGYSNITLTEGVNGGLVDVALEGNTMVNVCDQKDPVTITKSYTVETGNHVALQGEYDGKCRPVVTGNTLVNLIAYNSRNSTVSIPVIIFNQVYTIKTNTTYTLITPKFDSTKTQMYVGYNGSDALVWYQSNNIVTFTTGDNIPSKNIYCYYKATDKDLYLADTQDFVNNVSTNYILLEGDYTNKPMPDYFEGLQSTFEDKVVTQQMVDNGEELAENLGKYKVDYVISREDGTVGQTKTFYLNSPPLEGDTIEQQGNNVVHVHRYGKVVLDGSSDENWKDRGTDNLDGSIWHRYFIIINGMKNLSQNVICDKLSYAPYGTETIGWQTGSGQSFIIQNKLSVYTTPDIAGFKLWLQSNPTTVVYQLATPTYEVISQNDTILCDSYVNGHLDVDSIVPIERVDFLHFEEDLTYLYANTQYTVQFTSDKAITADIILGGTQLLSQSIVQGLNRISITTPATLADNKLIINGVGANISEVVVTEATDQDFGYFEGMKSVGECEDLEVVSSNSDGTLSNKQTLTHEPLGAVRDIKDKYVLIDGKWYIERNCGVRAYQEGDIDNYITDMINTVYPLQTPTYEPIDYNPFELYSDITHISNNSTIPCNMTIKNTGYNCLLKPSTTYTVSSNLGLNVVTTPSTLTEDCLRFYDTDTSTVTTMKNVMVLEGDYTTGKPIPSHFSGIESAFEQEYDEAVGKYRAKARVQNEDASRENYIEFYINEPLRGIRDVKDKVYVKNDKVVVERKCGQREYQDGDFGTYLTDKVNTVYPLATPTYEEVEYHDVKLFIELFKNSTLFYNSNIPVTSKLYYSYSVPIVDTVAQTEDISNQQDSMIIDMATQIAVMEMMLM